MLSNKQLKYLKSLYQRKFRQKYGIFIAEGVKTAAEIIYDGNIQIERVLATDEWMEANVDFTTSLPEGVCQKVSENELNAVSLLKQPNQVFFVLKQQKHTFPATKNERSLFIYLDEIRDPGNMGTILRIADWFGVKWVFCSDKCVEIHNPKVIQSSMGAFLRIKTNVLPLTELKTKLPNTPIIGTTLDGSSLQNSNLTLPAIIVIGNESNGISKATQELLDHKISIPRHPEGGAESLNAAVATGIICSFISNLRNR